MDKTIVGLLGAIGALVVATPGNAAPLPPTNAVLHASSYSELLQPVPNALATLRAMDEAASDEAVVVQVAHHHHRYVRRRHYRRHY